MWCVLVLRSGRFAGAIFDGHSILVHKVRIMLHEIAEMRLTIEIFQCDHDVIRFDMIWYNMMQYDVI